MKWRFRTGWGCLRAIPAWVLVFCSDGFAQAPNPRFRVDVDLTLIDVQVVDTATGQPIRNLRRSDFVVVADGQPRDIAVFEPENTPLDLAVVLDLSGIQLTLRVAGRVIGRPDPVRARPDPNARRSVASGSYGGRFLLLPAAPGLWSHVASRLAEGCPRGRDERTDAGA